MEVGAGAARWRATRTRSASKGILTVARIALHTSHLDLSRFEQAPHFLAPIDSDPGKVVVRRNTRHRPASVFKYANHARRGHRIGRMDQHRTNRRARRQKIGHIAADPGINHFVSLTPIWPEVVVEANQRDFAQVIAKPDNCVGGVVKRDNEMPQDVLGQNSSHCSDPVRFVVEYGDRRSLHATIVAMECGERSFMPSPVRECVHKMPNEYRHGGNGFGVPGLRDRNSFRPEA